VTSAIDPRVAGKRLLILGAGLWQLEYIRRARALGVETWATDWSESAVGRTAADHFEPIDVTDVEGTLALARRARIDGVFTAADVAVPTAAAVASELGLPGHPLELASAATNKRLMRERSRAAGIRYPGFQCVSSPKDATILAAQLGLPVIVKPVDNCSSRGVRFVHTPDELAPAIDEALAASRSREAIVEQFLTGTEGSIEVLVQDGDVVVLGVCDKTKSALPFRFDLELRYPGRYDAPVQREIEQLATHIVSAFDVRDGILHIEFLVADSTQDVFLIEFAVRGCGSKVITHLMPALTGIDVSAWLIRRALGVRDDGALVPRRGSHGALHFLMFPSGMVSAVRGVDEARSVPGVIDVCVEPVPGDMIGQVRDGRSRPGHLLVSGPTREDVQRVIARVRDLVRIDYANAVGVAAV
jgi:biotin carboxylase